MLGGPKLKDCPESSFLEFNFSANFIYPLRGSRTCWNGLVDSGDFMLTGIFFTHALTQSGTILFSAQSPPPITLPALAEQSLILLQDFSEKKDLQ